MQVMVVNVFQKSKRTKIKTLEHVKCEISNK